MSRRSGAMEKDNEDSEVSHIKAADAVTIAHKSSAISSRKRENREGEGENVYGSIERQNFVILSILLASLCGCFSILTLTCSIPAILASIRSHYATEKGDHRRARYLGNISLTLMILTLLFGIVLAIFLTSLVVGLAPLLGPCGFTLHKCTNDMFGRHLDTMACLRYSLWW